MAFSRLFSVLLDGLDSCKVFNSSIFSRNTNSSNLANDHRELWDSTKTFGNVKKECTVITNVRYPMTHV